MSLLNRWIDLIYKTATGSWQVKLILAPLAVVVFLSLIISFILLSLACDRWLGLTKVFYFSPSLTVGSCLIVLGLSLMLFSIAYFLRVRGTPVPLSPPPKLVTTGPYRFTRNPMLTGLFILLFGLGIALGSLSLVFIFTPFFIIINVWELKKVEEPELTRRLGKAYLEYKKQVPMFFPFFTKE